MIEALCTQKALISAVTPCWRVKPLDKKVFLTDVIFLLLVFLIMSETKGIIFQLSIHGCVLNPLMNLYVVHIHRVTFTVLNVITKRKDLFQRGHERRKIKLSF